MKTGLEMKVKELKKILNSCDNNDIEVVLSSNYTYGPNVSISGATVDTDKVTLIANEGGLPENSNEKQFVTFNKLKAVVEKSPCSHNEAHAYEISFPELTIPSKLITISHMVTLGFPRFDLFETILNGAEEHLMSFGIKVKGYKWDLKGI